MDSEQRISEMIESGEYFRQSRAWYRALYLAPIAERSFFLVIAALAAAIGFLGFIALMAFLPLNSRPALLVPSDRLYDTVPELVRLADNASDITQPLMRFYIRSYVEAREGYAEATYARSYRFLRAQSDAPTFQKYAATYGRENPQSPAAILGATGKRIVTVRTIDIKETGDLKVATVTFTTELEGRSNPSRTNWTAVLQFYYSDLVVNHSKDTNSGDDEITTQDPQFQVVDYALTKSY